MNAMDALKTLPEGDPVESVRYVISQYFDYSDESNDDCSISGLVQYHKLLGAVCSKIGLSIPPIRYTEDHRDTVKKAVDQIYISIKDQITDMETVKAVEEIQEAIADILKDGFAYEFTTGDLKRIQQLINELRDQITPSEWFEPDHKERVLNRLEALQRELHKRMSNLDRFYGLVGDVGVMLGKFGTDAKPFIDRIREILQIVWRTQSAANELPTGKTFDLLPEVKQDQPQ